MLRRIERPQPVASLDERGRPADVWVVWFVRMHGLFALIGIGLAIGVWFQPGISVLRASVTVGLLVVLAGWIWICLFREPPLVAISPAIYMAVALVMYIALGVAWPATMLLLFLAYWQMYSLLRLWPAIVTTAIFTIANTWAQQGFPATFPITSGPALGILAVSVTFSGIFAWFIGATIRQSTDRQRLIEELRQTQASLAASEREQGMLTERHRMAGDVHDTIAQDFTSILMSLEAARSRLATKPDEAGTYLELARSAARNGLGESRRIVQAIRPELLTGRSLEDALRHLAEQWSRKTGVPTTFTIDGPSLTIGRDQDVAVFRALQESFTNIQKHARATHVDVTLSFLGDLVILDVRDNGRGFDPDHLPVGVGLETMRERARRFGGSVEVETGPGEGVALSFSLPIATEAAP